MAFHLQQDQRRVAVIAGVIGNVVEWYDFALYGFLASVFSGVFFAGDNPLVTLIATYGVFAVGFIMRPLGSVVFGWLGDTIGRSHTLVLSVAMMALPTMILGLLPSYAMVGVAAPILLLLVRVVQGLSVGGEFSASVTYLVETAPPDQRGLAGSWANIGSIGGMLLGSGAAAATVNLFPPDMLQTWGWRVPFLLGGILGGVGLLLRRGLPESSQFQRHEEARCPQTPIREAFSCNRAEMFQGVLVASGYGALFYLVTVYLPTWINETSGLALSTAMTINTLTLALLLPLIPLSGWVSDRWIRRTRLLAAAFVLLGVAGVSFLFWMVGGTLSAFVWGQLLLGLLLSVVLGVEPALFTELFPEEDRLTGYSIVYNAGLGVVGGVTPMLASWLILVTGSPLAPAALFAVMAAVGVLGLRWMRDGSREPLPTSCRTSVHEAFVALDEQTARERTPAAATGVRARVRAGS
ncbi:MFS transporter [Salinisphaera orenii]|uniref:MFS transporter n=1 Tax=Salinisphaera orenii TaxID=856731 RepID=UPI0019551714